ncbi:HNH endonuclease [Streptomyces sp. NPDC004528]|uniref:HNH endonuclease n=1 Tax=Streptomyces sp. NPDC004528 TaxID=3154550 RepID=UPI0033A68B11
MTPARPSAPRSRRVCAVDRTVAGKRSPVVRSVPRPVRITPPLRPVEPPHGPSRRDVLRRWEDEDLWSCTYCDASFGQTVVAEVDHIRPVAGGGVHEWSNLAPACAPCNRDKGAREVGEWLTEPQVRA